MYHQVGNQVDNVAHQVGNVVHQDEVSKVEVSKVTPLPVSLVEVYLLVEVR